jgi:hypothetical protein
MNSASVITLRPGPIAWLWETTPPERIYTDFLSDLKNSQVISVHLQGGEIRGEDKIGRKFRTFSPDLPTLIPLEAVREWQFSLKSRHFEKISIAI